MIEVQFMRWVKFMGELRHTLFGKALNKLFPSYTLTVDKNPSAGDFTTIQDAIDSLPFINLVRVVIKVNAGTYTEKVNISPMRAFITIEGAGADRTLVQWGDTAQTPAKNITFKNTTPVPPPGAIGKQAVALRISGDTATLWVGCHVHAISENYGALTAQNRMSLLEDTGFSFVNCKVTGSGALYLGRAWGTFSRVVFAYTYMDDIIIPRGWYNWGDPNREMTVFYGQYKCIGPGANYAGRVAWSRELTDEEAKPFISLGVVWSSLLGFSLDLGMGSNEGSSASLHVPRQYGVTKPLSTAGPTEADLQRSLELEKFLADAGLYESKDETVLREEVLGQIDQIVKSWVKHLTRQRGYTDQMVEDANAVIYTFGSYRLGVHGPGADIDTLCVGPSYVNREEEKEEVTELQPVPDAHVPVMKFKFRGISIDLLYASISLLVVPEDLDISCGSVLYDVDEPTVRSLNGCRVADQILRLVPNVEVALDFLEVLIGLYLSRLLVVSVSFYPNAVAERTTAIPQRSVYGPLISAISVTSDFDDSKLSTGAILGIVAAACVLIALISIFIWFCLRRKVAENNELQGLELQTGYFTLRQIKAATSNFDPANKIGEGGFGPVYKMDRVIAVKQLSSKSKQGNREFINEIGMISALHHPNLVKLFGCCIEENQLLLVYEYMENNSLASALFGPERDRLKLDWQTRHRICLSIARGLVYLHEESRLKIVHRDIKATNVLLDKDLNAKISDFGLARLSDEDESHISTRIAGTIGYMAPEYAMRGNSSAEVRRDCGQVSDNLQKSVAFKWIQKERDLEEEMKPSHGVLQWFLFLCFLVWSCSETPLCQAQRLDPHEVEALRKIGSKLGKQWDFTVDPCLGTSGWVDPTTDEDHIRAANVTCGNCNALPHFATATSILPQEADLTHNFLGGTIPVAWTSLPLITLSLLGNRISGSIPEELGNITTLNVLVLEDNRFKALFLRLSWQTEKLRTAVSSFFIRIDGNPISGKIPSFIVNWLKIQQLEMQGTTLEGPFPPNFSTLKTLSELRVTDWKGGDGKFPPLENMKVLTRLVLRNLSLSGELPEYIGDYNLFINCGGPAWTIGEDEYQGDMDTEGPSYYNSYNDKWAYSSTGSFVHNDNEPFLATNVSVLNMSNPELYMNARLSPLSLKYYGLCLQNGNYTVNLHFAEIMFNNDQTYFSIGRRFFDASIQGKKVLRDFNIEKEAKGTGQAIVKSFTANVSDNTLEIHFQWAGKGTNAIPEINVYGPLVSAISVTPDFTPIIYDSLSNRKETKISTGAILGIVAAGCVLIVLISIFIWFFLRRKYAANNELQGVELLTGYFTLRQIKAATRNFDAANKLGEGGFGPVYKGILPDGSVIAVKQLSAKSRQGNREFINEIGMISALQHPNLVKLFGCCIEGNQLLLIYEYMENNNLGSALFGREREQLNLDWKTRCKICLGIARGLAYLHEESRLKIVHRDIKATNVLLDKDLNAKISDFGLARLCEEDGDKTHISTRIAGTVGYMAPEYAMRGYLTDKADVYSFGVVMLEIVSGLSNTHLYKTSDDFIYLLDWALILQGQGELLELVDKNLGSNYPQEEALQLLNLALTCTNSSPSLRPTMSTVVSILDGKSPVSIPSVKPTTSSSDVTRFSSSLSMDGPWLDSSVSFQSSQDENTKQTSKLLSDFSNSSLDIEMVRSLKRNSPTTF
ncbi:hypothetical protein J5N97_004715 [Dioscorea zingiberensis]|uniref:Protein kinase domain-containing protein n=1 Tax=Dioscorea zingiberensis TaxID=325984 RepID=A0A9D5HRR3_9LILI|nr:hypothetical protein J5N97_004715 [Dioscorea zingiberensis]